MGIKYSTNIDKFPQMIRTIKTINSTSVEVGCIEGEHSWLAAIHEYGCNIEVTPKMRAYLHAQGLHLSKNTTHIHIPERSFLRAGHDKEAKSVMEKASKVVVQVLNGRMSEQQLFDMVGQMLATKIKTYAVELSNPPNHPFTIEQKGSSNPLVGGGENKSSSSMIEGITWRVKKGGV